MGSLPEPACAWCWKVFHLRYACACLPPSVMLPAPTPTFLPLAEFKRRAMVAAMKREGTANKAAKALGISRWTLRYWLKFSKPLERLP